MNGLTVDKLNLNPRTHEELRGIVTSLERKWQDKARRAASIHRAM